MKTPVLCIGEVLWDLLPDGPRPGGAPMNVAYNLSRLGTPTNILSRVGSDQKGAEMLEILQKNGISEHLIQQDEKHETGVVDVQLDQYGHPRYTIRENAAWDFLQRPELEMQPDAPEVIVFGSLAQRNSISRATIRSFWNTPGEKVFDVNLRKPFDDRSIVEESLFAASLCKLNDEELIQINRWFALGSTFENQMQSLSDRFQIPVVCVTCGSNGAYLWKNDTLIFHKGFSVDVADTIGAGDAFLAGLLHCLLSGKSNTESLAFANACGAYVASQSGAITDISEIKVMKMLQA